MSYNISVSGHLDGEDAAEREAAIVEKARAFVQRLEGVASAYGSFQHAGPVDFKAEQDAKAGDQTQTT